MRAAVLDVGSNTVRLLVAEPGSRGLRTICAEGVHLGLACDIERDGWISAAKLGEARALASRYAQQAREHDATVRVETSPSGGTRVVVAFGARPEGA